MHTCETDVMFLFGTRPEAIKLCPVFLAMQTSPLRHLIVNTGQHRDMVGAVLEHFGYRADIDLQLMHPDQTPLSLLTRMLERLPPLFAVHRPRAVVVHGDTVTAFAGMLCAYLCGIPVVHIEAGLRTGNAHAPFPEEFFRTAIDAATDLLLPPTADAMRTLLREGRDAKSMVICGNTAIDALRLTLQKTDKDDHDLDGAVHLDGQALTPEALQGRRLLLLTTHRRELHPQQMRSMLQGIAAALREREDVVLLFPVHPSPRVREAARSAFADCPAAHLLEPLPLPLMHRLLSRATLLLTDSGGLQEEAVYLGLPTLVLRECTERPEGVRAGVLRPVGCDGAAVRAAIGQILADEAARLSMAKPSVVYGDGYAAQRIVQVLQEKIGGFV